MTAICGGGSSGPKPGVDSSVYVDGAYIRSLMPATLAWLYPYLPWLPNISIGDVSAFCSTDPPDIISTPSSADFLNLLTGGNIGASLAVTDFISRILKQYLWRELCQCGVGSPTAVSPPSNPGNLPSVNNPTLVSPATPGTCFDITSSTVTFTPGGSLQRTIVDIGGTGGGVTGPSTRGYWVQWDTTVATASVFCPLTIGYHVLDVHSPSNTVYFNGSYTLNAPQTKTILQPIPVGATQVDYTVNAGSTGISSTEFTRTRIWCTESSPTLPNCCSNGPDTTNQKLEQILSLVTLIQRLKAPYAYIDGATHSGLSGTGVLTIPNGLIGLRTTVTTNPAYTGEAGSNPTALFEIGYESVGDSTGWADVQRISKSPWLYFPQDMSSWTRVGYNLNPGVVVSITELEPEA